MGKSVAREYLEFRCACGALLAKYYAEGHAIIEIKCRRCKSIQTKVIDVREKASGTVPAGKDI